jgi:hypothetical protein
VTLAADRLGDNGLHRPEPSPDHDAATGFVPDRRPVEFWPTSAIHAAMENGDLATWQRIATALKRDPYGRTARQVEEVLETASAYGISEALAEVLTLSRAQLDRSGLGHHEFASRIGVSAEMLTDYLQGAVSLPASQLVRMRRLADRFAKIRAQRSSRSE